MTKNKTYETKIKNMFASLWKMFLFYFQEFTINKSDFDIYAFHGSIKNFISLSKIFLFASPTYRF